MPSVEVLPPGGLRRVEGVGGRVGVGKHQEDLEDLCLQSPPTLTLLCALFACCGLLLRFPGRETEVG